MWLFPLAGILLHEGMIRRRIHVVYLVGSGVFVIAFARIGGGEPQRSSGERAHAVAPNSVRLPSPHSRRLRQRLRSKPPPFSGSNLPSLFPRPPNLSVLKLKPYPALFAGLGCWGAIHSKLEGTSLGSEALVQDPFSAAL